MKDEVLLELANRWESDAKTPDAQCGDEASIIPNAVQEGVREGKRECADALRSLVSLLGKS